MLDRDELWSDDDSSGPTRSWADDAAKRQISGIESMISSAGQYVWPTDDLRPRVTEMARDRAGRRHSLWRLAAMMLAAMLCGVAGVSVSSRLQARTDTVAMPRGERLEQMIEARVTSLGETPDWALSEVVERWRSNLALCLIDSETQLRRGTLKSQNE